MIINNEKREEKKVHKTSADIWLILGVSCFFAGTIMSIFCFWYDKPITIPIGNLLVIGIVEVLGSEILRAIEGRKQ